MRRLLLPLVITVAAALAVTLAAGGRETREELNYVAQLDASATTLSRDGDELRVVIGRLARIDRSELTTVIDELTADLLTASEFTEVDPPSSRLIAVQALFREAVRAWTAGVTGLSSGLLTAADEPENSVVVDNVANALAEIRAGDALYAEMAVLFEESDMPQPVAALPQVRILPAEGGLESLARAYVEAARAESNSLALRPGLAVSQIVANPAWAVNPSDQVVMPATDVVAFSVVITNVGNVTADEERLRLRFTGGIEPVELTQIVAALGPRAQVAVRFEPLAVVPGGIYEVTAELIITGDDEDLEDNALTVEFRVNEE